MNCFWIVNLNPDVECNVDQNTELQMKLFDYFFLSNFVEFGTITVGSNNNIWFRFSTIISWKTIQHISTQSCWLSQSLLHLIITMEINISLWFFIMRDLVVLLMLIFVFSGWVFSGLRILERVLCLETKRKPELSPSSHCSLESRNGLRRGVQGLTSISPTFPFTTS